MAVATPVLEREKVENKSAYGYSVQAEEDTIHNSLISERYQRIVNPNATRVEPEMTFEAKPAEQNIAEEAQVSAPAPAEAQPLYRVESARTHSALFCADSPINQAVERQQEIVAETESDEEENEDLRPTQTTIQYKTASAKKTEEEGVIENSAAAKRMSLSKRDKIIIGVVVSIIVALFVLIIVNSAIITGLNNDLGSLQSSLNQAKSVYQRVANEVTEYNANLEETVRALAESLGMSK